MWNFLDPSSPNPLDVHMFENEFMFEVYPKVFISSYLRFSVFFHQASPGRPILHQLFQLPLVEGQHCHRGTHPEGSPSNRIFEGVFMASVLEKFFPASGARLVWSWYLLVDEWGQVHMSGKNDENMKRYETRQFMTIFMGSKFYPFESHQVDFSDATQATPIN